MLSREELIKRGARFADGSKVEDEQQEGAASAPLVAEPKIDMTPVADAVRQLSDVVKTALDSQRPILEQIVEKQSQPVEKKSPPEEWEFTIARDARGRMESIRAKVIS